VTLVWIQPGTLKAQFVFWARDNLTAAERIALRLASGHTDDLSTPVPDSALEGEITAASIVDALRLPSERLSLRSA
jgi:hypothetical protein